jgi:hypothetical protein
MGVKTRVTRELVEDLDKFYGIDVEKELAEILQIEIEKASVINDENLIEDGWILGTNPETGKKVWIKIIFDEDKLPPLIFFEYDPETQKIKKGKEDKEGLGVCRMIDLRLYTSII